MIARLAHLESLAVELVANAAPWLAPLPTAWLVANRAMTHLHWPLWIAIVAGVTLELLGVGILATWLMLYAYNRDRRKTDPKAAEWLAVLLMILYFLTAEALTFALDVWPVAAVVAPALFPVLSVAAFVLLALRADHRRRLDAIVAENAERKAQRAEQKAQRDTKVDASPQVPIFQSATEAVRWWKERNPEWTQTQLAAQVGCAASTVSRALHSHGRATMQTSVPLRTR